MNRDTNPSPNQTVEEPAASLLRPVERLVTMLRAEGIEQPLAEQFTLACVLDDLFGCADSMTPNWITATLEVEPAGRSEPA